MDRNWAATGCQLACIDREATNTPRHTRCMLCCGIRTRHQGGRCEFPLCYRSHCFCGADGDGTSSLMSREKSGLRPAALARSAIWERCRKSASGRLVSSAPRSYAYSGRYPLTMSRQSNSNRGSPPIYEGSTRRYVILGCRSTLITTQRRSAS